LDLSKRNIEGPGDRGTEEIASPSTPFILSEIEGRNYTKYEHLNIQRSNV